MEGWILMAVLVPPALVACVVEHRWHRLQMLNHAPTQRTIECCDPAFEWHQRRQTTKAYVGPLVEGQMISVYQDIKGTLESPGAAHIRRALLNAHKGLYRRMRTCTPEELPHLQAAMYAIDTTLPQIIEKLLNLHLQQVGKNPPPRQEYFFEKFFPCSQRWVETIKKKWKPSRRDK